MLLSGSAGAASGALYDADRLDKGDEAIEQFGALVPTGGNALLAETVGRTLTEPLDAFVSGMGGTIVRRPLDEVVAELDGVGLCRKHRAQPRRTREERNLPVTGSGDSGEQLVARGTGSRYGRASQPIGVRQCRPGIGQLGSFVPYGRPGEIVACAG